MNWVIKLEITVTEMESKAANYSNSTVEVD
jgi:hypothetical protein